MTLSPEEFDPKTAKKAVTRAQAEALAVAWACGDRSWMNITNSNEETAVLDAAEVMKWSALAQCLPGPEEVRELHEFELESEEEDHEKDPGWRLYLTLALFDTRDDTKLANLVAAARDGYEHAHMDGEDFDGAWEDFDEIWARSSSSERLMWAKRAWIESSATLGFYLGNEELEALYFHYTKNGIPKSAVAARELAEKIYKELVRRQVNNVTPVKEPQP